MRNSIFLAPLGGAELNSLSVNFGARSQLLITTVNCGSPATFFDVRMNLRGSGLLPVLDPDLPIDLRSAKRKMG